MTFSDESYNLRIELDCQGCELSPREIAAMEMDVDTLASLVDDFPVSDLHVTVVYHHKPDDYHVKTNLVLSGTSLFTGERDSLVQPAFEACMRKLVKKVRAYKRQMRVGEDAEKQSAGTRHQVTPNAEVNLAALILSVSEDDYPGFRGSIDVFAPSLASRIAHWVDRYPEMLEGVQPVMTVEDILEEVFLNAFDGFEKRPHNVPPGTWLEHLIDPSVQALLQSPDEEYQRVEFSKLLVS